MGGVSRRRNAAEVLYLGLLEKTEVISLVGQFGGPTLGACSFGPSHTQFMNWLHCEGSGSAWEPTSVPLARFALHLPLTYWPLVSRVLQLSGVLAAVTDPGLSLVSRLQEQLRSFVMELAPVTGIPV